MPDYKDNIDVSIIIPIYNQADHVEACVESLLQDQVNDIRIEVMLIDDGSTDSSRMCCERLQEKYNFIKYFYQDNQGVSVARNKGIMNAAGKYLFFLDSDDRLEPGTVSKVIRFFDTVEDEVDLVTYQIDTIYEGRMLKPHFRYQYLTKSGVYDLREWPYIGQTTMNIVVKNKYIDNILFDINQNFSEDQRYCCQVLKDKLKMGFCSEGRYLYYRSNTSSSGRLSGACFVFEQCTNFFEELFSWYPNGEIPVAFQGLFVNDYYWKLCCNMLFPHHYEGDAYNYAVDRLYRLLSQCEDKVILNHPTIDFFEKYYMLRIKGNSNIRCLLQENGFGLVHDDSFTVFESSAEIVMTKCKVINGKLILHGFFKSVFYQFYHEKPSICVVENNGELTRKLTVRPSAHNYYLSHEDTQRFWAFTYECDIQKVNKFHFEMGVGDKWYPTHFYFMPLMPFSHEYKRYEYKTDTAIVKLNHENEFLIKCVSSKKKEPIWLYYDCSGVETDNGMLQFLHDCKIEDGIRRYYIVSDERQWQKLPNAKYGVVWGSKFHKKLILKCDKIVTAFIEEKNIIPFPEEEYAKYAGRFCFEVIYLQHGVLHIDMPWKYTPERIMADKVVVSTVQEAKLFIRNGFQEKNLIKSRMPRFAEKREKQKDSRKILFAPSWRSYLVGSYGEDRKWERMDQKFLCSNYYLKIREWLESETLHEVLARHNLELEVKLHPIFSIYKEYFKINNANVKVVEKADTPEKYVCFITDFSSYAYDFLFCKIPVFYFLPDSNEFRSGMNGYRNLGEEDYWYKCYRNGEDLTKSLLEMVNQKDMYCFDMDFYSSDNPMKEIYHQVF